MYLNKLHIKNFRCIEDLTLDFKKGVNILIGENNTGKTAIIDALRLALSIGSERRNIYVSTGGFFINRFGEQTNEIQFDLTFCDLTEEELGLFVEMLSLEDGSPPFLELHLRYELEKKNGIERIKSMYWGGRNEGQSIPFEIMSLFYHVYLGALRDAQKDLRPMRGSRLGELFLKLANEKEQDHLAKKVIRNLREDMEWEDLISEAKERINEHLEKTTLRSAPQSIEIDFLPLEFKRMVEKLNMYNPFSGVVTKEEVTAIIGENSVWEKYFTNPGSSELIFKSDFRNIVEKDDQLTTQNREAMLDVYERTHRPFSLDQNGLGYNNLIFIATVIGDLFERRIKKTESYISLLIEEPEAHLHPQLQDTLFNYFKNMEEYKMQVFISSHSPTITAKTNIDSVIVLDNIKNEINRVSVNEIPLRYDNKRYLERFLDVTKSQLFYAKGVILLEGISEALLLPIFAKLMGEEYDLDKTGIEVVNIGGVAFEPFANLFNSDNRDKRLHVKCAILTDNDKDENGEISPRAKNAKNLEDNNLKVFLAEKTFEYELYIGSENSRNEQILRAVYKELHPRFRLDISDTTDIQSRAKAFVDKLKKNKDKAIFAQKLANGPSQEVQNFSVPNYIKEAIKWVTDDEF